MLQKKISAYDKMCSRNIASLYYNLINGSELRYHKKKQIYSNIL